MTQLLVDHVLGLLKGVANVDGVIWLASWEKIEDDPYAPAVSPCVEDSDVPTKFGVRFVFEIADTKLPLPLNWGVLIQGETFSYHPGFVERRRRKM